MIVDNGVIDGLTEAELAALESCKPRDFCLSFVKRYPIGLNEAREVYLELRAQLGM